MVSMGRRRRPQCSVMSASDESPENNSTEKRTFWSLFVFCYSHKKEKKKPSDYSNKVRTTVSSIHHHNKQNKKGLNIRVKKKHTHTQTRPTHKHPPANKQSTQNAKPCTCTTSVHGESHLRTQRKKCKGSYSTVRSMVPRGYRGRGGEGEGEGGG